MVERGPGGEARNYRPPGRCLSPTPANVYPLTGIGSCKPLLEHRAPPGRKVHIIVSTYNGGTPTQPRAPGHERPHAALRAARHGRLSAAATAPGADIPPATTAGAPGQYCQSAAPRAPGHGRPLAITAGVFDHDRLSAAPIATVAPPAGHHRPHQEGLPYTPANPRTLTHSSAHQDTAHDYTTNSHHLNSHSCLPHRHSRESGNPRPPVPTGGPQGGYAPATRRLSHPTTHQAHPAIQVPPRPRPCSTADTGFSFNHPSRAPPLPAPQLPLSTWWRGGRVMGQRRTTPGPIRAALAHQWVRLAP